MHLRSRSNVAAHRLCLRMAHRLCAIAASLGPPSAAGVDWPGCMPGSGVKAGGWLGLLRVCSCASAACAAPRLLAARCTMPPRAKAQHMRAARRAPPGLRMRVHAGCWKLGLGAGTGADLAFPMAHAQYKGAAECAACTKLRLCFPNAHLDSTSAQYVPKLRGCFVYGTFAWQGTLQQSGQVDAHLAVPPDRPPPAPGPPPPLPLTLVEGS